MVLFVYLHAPCFYAYSNVLMIHLGNLLPMIVCWFPPLNYHYILLTVCLEIIFYADPNESCILFLKSDFLCQVADPLCTMTMGAPIEDAQQLCQWYDSLRQETENQVSYHQTEN